MSHTSLNKPGVATDQQSRPSGTGVDIPSLVQADIEARAVWGTKKYGERLRAFNGRNSLVDAYQECLDLSVYLRQLIQELGIEDPGSGKWDK